MDPEAALAQALDRLTYKDFEECSEFLENYREWRRRGGFEAENGDARHDRILRDLRALSGSFRFAGRLLVRSTESFEGVIIRPK